MVTDEIAPESWKGDVWSDVITTTVAPKRLKSISLRFKTVILQNYHSTYTVWIGKYNATTAIFIAGALYLKGLEKIELKFADLHELGCSTFAAGYDSSIRVLGINEY